MTWFLWFHLFSQNVLASEARIVSLHPAITENLFALGLGANVVGTTEYSDYPAEAKKIPRIGDHRFSLEKIISLKPTHLVAISDRIGISDELARKAGIKIVRVKFEEFEDFIPAIEQLGREFKTEAAEAKLKNEWNSSWAKFKYKDSNKTAVIQVQADPIVVAGQNTFLNSILSKCGIRNAIDSHGYPTLNRETLIKLSPSRVVLLLTDLDESTKQSTAKLWKNALKDRALALFDPNTISKLTPRLPGEAKKFCEILQ
jgi:ABC-type hemin transport system substrate-binding protein